MKHTKKSVCEELDKSREINPVMPEHSYNEETIKCGNYRISIQADKYHCCSPRETLPSMEEYSLVEIALFDQDNRWIHSDNLPATTIRFEEGDYPFAGYVSWDDLLEFMNQLEEPTP